MVGFPKHNFFTRLKSAVSYYENLNENVDHIIPLQTQPAYYPNGIRSVFFCVFVCLIHTRKLFSRDLSVSWEEQLVINEHLSYFTDNPNTILIFEVVLTFCLHNQYFFICTSHFLATGFL